MPLGILSGEDSGGDKVKITRSFTLDYHLCQELKKQKNQSQFVEAAVREKLKLEDKKMQIQFKCYPCDVVYTPNNKWSASRSSITCKKCGTTIDAETVQ
jgi:hypothetical protein